MSVAEAVNNKINELTAELAKVTQYALHFQNEVSALKDENDQLKRDNDKLQEDLEDAKNELGLIKYKLDWFAVGIGQGINQALERIES